MNSSRSSRLDKDTMKSTVRASKKGEVLLMRRLGKLDKRGSSPSEEPQDTVASADQGLAEVFAGPVDAEDFAAFRDIFLAARALSDADLMAVAG
jgi:hypothetical protein